MLRAENIHLQFGRRIILSNVSLGLNPGLVTAILGPNGAGKTTLLRVLSGEIQADAGNIWLDDQNLFKVPVRELGRRRAFLHQESSLDFAFTVLEVVLLGRSPHMRGSERPEDYRIARQALAEVDLSDREGDYFTQLSGGEKQRVHLARVLAQITQPGQEKSRYLFLDEPTNNLDLSHQETIFKSARKLVASGVAVCMVLHDLNQAIQEADQIFVMDQGRIALEGAPEFIARSDACERIFKVALRRIEVPGQSIPLLLPR